MRVINLAWSAIAVVTLALGLSGALAPAFATSSLPSAPLHVKTASPTTTTLEISWTAPVSDGGNDIEDYTVQYRKVGTLTWVSATHTASAATSLTLENLTAGSVYVVRVAAVTEAGTGPWNLPDVTLATGDIHACAISGGTVKCWGNGTNGRLGNGGTGDSAAAVTVLGINASSAADTAVSVTLGYAHSCALMATGTVKCWGSGSNGILGSGTSDSSTPVSVTGIDGATAATTAVSISAGAYHTCAVMADRTIKCWGYGLFGQIGNGANSFANPTPVTVSSIDGTLEATSAASVSAVAAAGTGATSPVSVAALAASDPGAPGAVNTKPTSKAGQLKVTWTAAAANGAPRVAYSVSWLVAGKWTKPVSASGLTYTITGLKKGTCSVKVTAITVEGSASATKSGITLAK
jgi:hypothetical protein